MLKSNENEILPFFKICSLKKWHSELCIIHKCCGQYTGGPLSGPCFRKVDPMAFVCLKAFAQL